MEILSFGVNDGVKGKVNGRGIGLWGWFRLMLLGLDY